MTIKTENKLGYYKNILLIDDNKIDLFIAEKILEQADLKSNIISMSSVSQSLLFLEETTRQNKNVPSLIFLDIVMPHYDAFYFINKFNELFSNAKVRPSIVILTASIDPQQKENLLKYNSVIGYIDKPLTINYSNHYLLLNSYQYQAS